MYNLLKYFSTLTKEFFGFCKIYWGDYGIITTIITMVIGAYFLVNIDKEKCIDDKTGLFSRHVYKRTCEDYLCVSFLSIIFFWCLPIIIICLGWLSLIAAPIGIGAGIGQIHKLAKRNKVTIPTATARESESLL